MQPYAGVTHYMLTRELGCPFMGLTPEPTTRTSTTTTTTTTTPPTTPQPPCFLKKMVDANSDGGTLLGIMTEQACAQQCLDRYPECKAVDYRTNDQSCYWHNVISGTQWNSCCNRYQITCTQTCVDSFVNFTDLVATAIRQTPPVTTVTTPAECQEYCLSRTTCPGFNWIRDGRDASQKCVVYDNAVGDATRLTLFDLYVRETCQPDMFITFPTATETPRTAPPRYCVLDIVLVVDMSSSIREFEPVGVDNVALMKTYLKSLVSPPIDVDLYYDHVGLVMFQSNARTLFDLDQRTTLEDVKAGIDFLPEPHGETNTPEALNLALQMLQSASLGARRNAKKVMLLLTDGHTTDHRQSAFLPVIRRLNNTNILRIAVGVTSNIDNNELLAFATNPGYVANILSFSDLSSTLQLSQNAMLQLCRRVNISTTPAGITTTTRGTPSQAPVSEVVFTFARNSSYSTTGTTVPLPVEVVNPGQRFYNSTFVTYLEGIHFVEVCVGVPSRRTALVKVNGGAPPFGFYWDADDQNGVTGGCRSMLMYFAPSIRLTMYLERGQIYGDTANQLTSLTVFSVSDVMVPTAVSSALLTTTNHRPNTTLVNYAIPFSNPIVTPTIPGTYSAATYTYTCIQSGPYLFSVSAAVPAGQMALVSLTGVDFFASMLRSAGSYSSLTTLSRSYLLQCRAGTEVRAVLAFGQINTGPEHYNLLTFLVLPYQPRSLTATSWAVYRSTTADASRQEIDPMTFDLVNVNQGRLYNSNNGIVTILRSGYYYVYMSAGARQHTTTHMTLKRTRQGEKVTLFALYRTSTTADGTETLGHGSILHLESRDQLNVAAESGNSIYSDADYQISFFGMLLYVD